MFSVSIRNDIFTLDSPYKHDTKREENGFSDPTLQAPNPKATDGWCHR